MLAVSSTFPFFANAPSNGASNHDKEFGSSILLMLINGVQRRSTLMKKTFSRFAFCSLMTLTLANSLHAAAFLADVTLSPVKTVLEIVVSPTAITMASSIATADGAADRNQILNAVASDAADHLSGASPTPLLKEVHSMLRQELARRGDLKAYSDQALSQMIAAEISAS
jgi:hypothetical protein